LLVKIVAGDRQEFRVRAQQRMVGGAPQGPSREPLRSANGCARDASIHPAPSVLDAFIRTLFGALRRRARALGIRSRECGAVTFIQRFGSALQLIDQSLYPT
jgi:hypothetical protein